MSSGYYYYYYNLQLFWSLSARVKKKIQASDHDFDINHMYVFRLRLGILKCIKKVRLSTLVPDRPRDLDFPIQFNILPCPQIKISDYNSVLSLRLKFHPFPLIHFFLFFTHDLLLNRLLSPYWWSSMSEFWRAISSDHLLRYAYTFRAVRFTNLVRIFVFVYIHVTFSIRRIKSVIATYSATILPITRYIYEFSLFLPNELKLLSLYISQRRRLSSKLK